VLWPVVCNKLQLVMYIIKCNDTDQCDTVN